MLFQRLEMRILRSGQSNLMHLNAYLIRRPKRIETAIGIAIRIDRRKQSDYNSEPWYFPGRRYGHITSNIAESLNSSLLGNPCSCDEPKRQLRECCLPIYLLNVVYTTGIFNCGRIADAVWTSLVSVVPRRPSSLYYHRFVRDGGINGNEYFD